MKIGPIRTRPWLALTLTGVLASPVPSALAGGSIEQQVFYEQEEPRARRAPHFDPRFLTPDPNRVEVLHFVAYTRKWAETEPLYQAWRASLPDDVDVVLLPVNPDAADDSTEQSLYYVAQQLGKADAAHRAIVGELERDGLRELRTPDGFKETLRSIGIDPEEYSSLQDTPIRQSPAGAVLRWARHHLEDARKRARVRVKWAALRWPVVVVNGKYILATNKTRDPTRTYRRANYLIRAERESRPSHTGPTNNIEFAELMATRSGELYRNKFTGRSRWTRVFNHWRNEIWALDKSGDVISSPRLVTDDGPAHFQYTWDGKRFRLQDTWRHALEYVPYRDRKGRPRRYGAFLFADWLADPATLTVPLRFKREDITAKFHSDGTADATTAKGTVTGTWWLEAGNLRLSLDGLEDWWPWQVAAHRLGFKAPKCSLVPNC